MAALQSLFAADVRGIWSDPQLQWLDEDEELPDNTVEFAQNLLNGVAKSRLGLDNVITRYAPAWPVSQLSVIDRNILRIALFELIYTPGTPRKTAINEAVEHARLARDAGASGLLVMPPHMWLRFGMRDENVVDYFTAIGEASGLDLIVHVYPSWTRASYSGELLATRARNPHVKVFKMGTREMNKYARDVRAIRETGADVTILTCHDEYLLASMVQGVDGALVGFASFIPELITELWRRAGSMVDIMDAHHHDLVLAITSHVPHLIAYNIVGTAADLETVTESEVIKYSAGGFRDFTRIAASDPVMWRDVFLHNRDAVLEMLGRFSEDLTALQRAIRWGDGEVLEALFRHTRDIRREVVEAGQHEYYQKNHQRDFFNGTGNTGASRKSGSGPR